jgi:cytoplasmic tRNA 2-thiolation protein 1
MVCDRCRGGKAQIQRLRDRHRLCKACFFAEFEREVHETIVHHDLFQVGERIAIAISGGKDSVVLAHVLKELNERHQYGLELVLLAIDEGIHGYRDASLAAVKRNSSALGLPLVSLSYDELYDGWTMDRVVSQIGRTNNCTFCGVFRRQALERGARHIRANKLATGHNADDMAETVFLNLVRGDSARLRHSADVMTGAPANGGTSPDETVHWLPRVKPLLYMYEKEIVMYAYWKRLDYFATECVYAPNAFRTFARDLVKELEALRPRAIIDTLTAAQALSRHADGVSAVGTVIAVKQCARCGYVSSQVICKACILLEHLRRGTGKEATHRHATRSVFSASDQTSCTESCAADQCKCP